MALNHYHKYSLRSYEVQESNAARRLRFRRENSLPTQTDIMLNLGPVLAQSLFNSLFPETKNQLGLEPKLEGPGELMWVAPAQYETHDQPTLEPVKDRRYLRSTTHEAIFEIGEKLMQKNDTNAQKKLKDAVRSREIDLKAEFQDELRDALKKQQVRLLKLYNRRLAGMKINLTKAFQKEFDEKVELLEREHKENLEKAIGVLHERMEEEVNAAVKAREDYLEGVDTFKREWAANQCFESYRERLECHMKKWLKLVEQVKVHAENKTQEALKKKETEDLHKVYKSLNCQYRNFRGLLDSTIESYEDKLGQMVQVRGQQEELIDALTSANKKLEEQNASWALLLKDLLKQFQKFVNYVFKEKPGQAEYVLSYEKLLEKRLKILQQSRMSELSEIGDSVKSLKSVSIELPSSSSSIETEELTVEKVLEDVVKELLRRILPSPTASQLEIDSIVSDILWSVVKCVIPSREASVVRPPTPPLCPLPPPPSRKTIVTKETEEEWARRTAPMKLLGEAPSSTLTRQTLNSLINILNRNSTLLKTVIQP